MKEYWKIAHEKYSQKDWIKKPTIFAQSVIGYFPTKGKILELGAGQGPDSRFFSKQGFEVTSTDLSECALGISRQNAEKENLEIKFLELDMEKDLPFEDNSFDVVYAHLSLHYFTDKRTREIFQEIRRVLKPGGIIAALFNTVDDKETKDQNFKIIEEDYYESPEGLRKRFFTVDYVKKITEGFFAVIIADAKGESYKDDIKTLIRFVGRKK